MIVYFDTEFTSLDFGLVFEMKLISAGFVAEDGQEFYFELMDNYQKSDCSGFVLEAVLPHLNNAKHGLLSVQAASKLKSWAKPSVNRYIWLAMRLTMIGRWLKTSC